MTTQPNGRLIGAALLAAILTAAFGFAAHVFAAEIVEPYVASVMAGRHVAPSWDVRVPAALTAIEPGVALIILCLLLRHALPSAGTFARGLTAGLLALALSGRLVRQPMMDFLVGNPLNVVAVQDGIVWLIWLGMGLIAAFCLDLTARPAQLT